ncbi:AAA family ATPase [Hahella ganghwensis]|uniref:bifunctional aminoglycoside phosphotransferase/ATP-binding protein n=1 Tax=Hahella ganghwensis TaxID=286420 RepID=UPI00036DB196|nr:AAA family ATPase [Hahella ganghwensis]
MSESLVQALKNPDTYPHPVSDIQLIETHISWVFLTGTYAYKVKKPMDYGFLDFTALEKRKFYCEEELRLNRRLVPDVYLEVIPISGTPEAPQLGGDGDPFEYAIKMRQFNPQTLDKMSHDAPELGGHLEQLALKVADFHLNQSARTDENMTYGHPDVVFEPVQQNFDQIRPLLSDPQELKQLEYLEGWAQSTFERLRPLMEKRDKDGFVRECHGDMHLANVTTEDGNVMLFDCIEFNDYFRWLDVYNDIGFLLMDLEDRGLKGFGYRVLNTYLEQTGDYQGLILLPFYKAYRAMVRCKIALFTMGAPGISEEMRQEEEKKYKRYMDLAESYMSVPARFLIITHGVSGSGKTTISSHLLERLGIIRLRSDIERKRLFGLKSGEKSHSDLDGGIYSPEANLKTYQYLAEEAEMLLQAGQAVIIDATFLHQDQRNIMDEVAAENGVPFAIVDCRAPQAKIEEWLEKRSAESQDAAEADVSVMRHQLTHAEPFTDDEMTHVVELASDNLEEIDALADRLASKLGRN